MHRHYSTGRPQERTGWRERQTAGSIQRHHPDSHRWVKPFKKKPNPLKAAKVTEIDYKDVALLRKFISDRGKIRSRRITGVTVQEQRELSKAIKNAREMALLPYATSGR